MQKALPIISKKFLIVIMAVMLVASMILFISPGKAYGAPTTTWYVAPATASPAGNNSNAGTSSAAPFLTITYAISKAIAGDTINVAAGNYNEAFTISKSLSLVGPNANINPNTGSPIAAAIITGQISIYANNVSVKGFTVTNPGYGGATIKGIYIYSAGATIGNIVLQNNILENINNSNSKGSYGIMVQGVVDGVNILDNKINNIVSAGWSHAIEVTPTANSSIVPKNVAITYNFISNITNSSHNDEYGFSLDSSGTVYADASQITFHNNNLLGVNVRNLDPAHILDATNNWWGNASGPSGGIADAANPSIFANGTGGSVSGIVAFFPWTGYVAPAGPAGSPVYTITATVSGNGSITPSGAFNISANAGQIYNITPNAGASITDVLVDGASVGPVSSYTFLTVNSNRTIQAIFSGGSGGIGVLGIDETMIDVLGIANADYSGFVTRCYRSILLREPDTSGLSGWVNALSGGLTGEDVASGFVYSAELAPYLTALDNTGYLNFLYNRVLGRAADLPGLNGWLSDMSGGMSRAEILVYFLNSPEWQTICNAYGVTP